MHQRIAQNTTAYNGKNVPRHTVMKTSFIERQGLAGAYDPVTFYPTSIRPSELSFTKRVLNLQGPAGKRSAELVAEEKPPQLLANRPSGIIQQPLHIYRV